MIHYQFGSRSRMGGIGCLLIGILALVATYYILKWVFTLLLYVSPILLLLTLLIKPTVLRDAFRWLTEVYRKNVFTGVFFTLLGILGFPVVALGLFLNAIRTTPAEQKQQEIESEYVDFEEIESAPLQMKETEKRREEE